MGKVYRLTATRYRRLTQKEGKVVGSQRFRRGDEITFQDEAEEQRLLAAGAIVPADADEEDGTEPVLPSGETAGVPDPEDPTGSGAASGAPTGGSTDQGDPDGQTSSGDPTVTSAPDADQFDPDTAEYDDLKAYVAEHGIETASQKKKDLIAGIKSYQTQS